MEWVQRLIKGQMGNRLQVSSNQLRALGINNLPEQGINNLPEQILDCEDAPAADSPMTMSGSEGRGMGPLPPPVASS